MYSFTFFYEVEVPNRKGIDYKPRTYTGMVLLGCKKELDPLDAMSWTVKAHSAMRGEIKAMWVMLPRQRRKIDGALAALGATSLSDVYDKWLFPQICVMLAKRSGMTMPYTTDLDFDTVQV
jgi:hypothetical protein